MTKQITLHCLTCSEPQLVDVPDDFGDIPPWQLLSERDMGIVRAVADSCCYAETMRHNPIFIMPVQQGILDPTTYSFTLICLLCPQYVPRFFPTTAASVGADYPAFLRVLLRLAMVDLADLGCPHVASFHIPQEWY